MFCSFVTIFKAACLDCRLSLQRNQGVRIGQGARAANEQIVVLLYYIISDFAQLELEFIMADNDEDGVDDNAAVWVFWWFWVFFIVLPIVIVIGIIVLLCGIHYGYIQRCSTQPKSSQNQQQQNYQQQNQNQQQNPQQNQNQQQQYNQQNPNNQQQN